jgi:hypothetical protein
LNHPPHASWLDFNACARVAKTLAGIGRILLMLTAFSLITMPVTQHLWAWDNFLHGGQDFELGILMLLSLLSLVLVLTKHSKQCIDSLFAACSLLAANFSELRLPRIPMPVAFTDILKDCVSSSSVNTLALPLKI